LIAEILTGTGFHRPDLMRWLGLVLLFLVYFSLFFVSRGPVPWSTPGCLSGST